MELWEGGFNTSYNSIVEYKIIQLNYSLAAFIIVNEFRDKITVTEHTLLILFCFVVASLIDVDHFIHAKSFSLKVGGCSINNFPLKRKSIANSLGSHCAISSCIFTLQHNYNRTICCLLDWNMLSITSVEFIQRNASQCICDTSYSRCCQTRILVLAIWSYITMSLLCVYHFNDMHSACTNLFTKIFSQPIGQ